MQSNNTNPNYPIFLRDVISGVIYGLFSESWKVRIDIHINADNAKIERSTVKLDTLIKQGMTTITRDEFMTAFETAESLIKETCFDVLTWDNYTQDNNSRPELITDTTIRHGMYLPGMDYDDHKQLMEDLDAIRISDIDNPIHL